MLKVKIKTEKPDIEGSGARGRLDAVLQGLVEKNENSERDQIEDDAGKTATDSLSKDLSPSSAGKRPSARFPQHRRKKRKEMEDSIAESNQHKQNAYIIKLFDRSVDLAQFSTSTPLYPICRAWMRNNPTVRDQSASPSPPQNMSDDEVVDMINGKSPNVYRLPPPTPCPTNSSGEPVNLRIPPIVKATLTECTDAASTATPLMYNHMARWKKIRQKWKESSNKNQLRYGESIKILKDMYDR
ncbi:protein lin-37 homolog [Clupea harengus]|uniref:Protein lin-37 homolog n=1 Tax=Clupea harengus TaxID=7950 RepID=A0A6P8GAL7_CLUHA|nr:protein lin-37 homolog [Clupea harengus]XP_031432621.1 protein lin-37 homolog [Clupea harengus]XP_031432622.1 protein lin-37 homolog [Clupea harengus]